MYFSPENFEKISQSGYALLGGRLGWESSDGRFSLALFIHNALDREYLADKYDLGLATGLNGVAGRPRTFDAEGRIRLGGRT